MKLLILALTVSAVYASTFQVGLNFKPSQDKRQLYSSKLLHHVQMSRIFPDSKTFVDMHMKRDEKAILNAFDELLAKTNERPTKEQLTDFISYNFDSESGLESWRPSDFVSEPGFLNSIKDSQLKLFARNVYSMLPTLGRKMKPAVFKNPEQFSMIPVHNGFIVPGGNTKEFNYMESYWIIESLLISGMKETAKGMISNFIELQREFGYIPSGDRYYYLGRSQPPLLSAMMAIYLQETNDIEFLRANIDAIEGELEYWLDTHSVVFDVAGREYSLLRYITQCRGPRPEEYYQDFTNAQVFDNEQRQEQFYTDMKAAAESGWVMSSRWIMNKNGSNLGDLSWMHTTDIVPVDLNAIFASAVQNVAHFYSVLNDARRGAHWLEIRKRWVNSIKEVLWNEEEGMWFDWDLSSSQHRKYFYTSNLSPLWMGVVEPEFMKAKSQLISNYLRRTHSLEYPGGVPASLTKSGYLYDLPYAYPAQVSIVVSALEALQTEEASKMAFEVAQNLVRSMYKAYQTNKQLYAKYDVETPGKPLIASGEYFNEEAFGGTIGVIIEMLAKYGATMTSVKGYVPFPSKFGQYSQFYSTSAPQIVNYQYSAFPAKPSVSVAKPESSIKPVYTNEYKKPSVAPTYFAQTTYLPSEPTKPTLAEVQPEHLVSVEKKPEVTTHKDEEYVSTTYKPEYITSAPIKPYQPIPTEAKVEAVPVYNKPTYTTFVPQKPTLVTEVKPEVVPTVYPTKPVYTSFGSKPQYFASVKPTYVAPVKPVPTLPTNKFELPVSKPTYVAPQPLKPEYVSFEAKPEPQLLEKKPEYLHVSPVPQKPEYISIEAKPEPQLPVAPVPLKNEYISVEAKPEHQLLEKKPEYVAPVPQKPELLPVAPVPQKPEYLSVAPVPQKPTYLPTAPVPQKPEYLPVAPVPQKPLYVSVQTKPESQLFNKKPEYVSVVETKPEVVPTAYPAKPSYTSSIVSKPEYVSVQAKPESILIEKKPEYIHAADVKPEVVATIYNKPLYPTSAPVKPTFVIEAKPQVAPTRYPAQPLYSKPVQTSNVAPLSLKPEYVSVEAKPESQLPEKKPEYVTDPAKPSYTSSIVSKPEYVSVQTKPESVLIEKKPEYVHAAEVKPEVVATVYNKPLYPTSAPVKPTFVIEAKPQVAPTRYPAQPLYSKLVQTSNVAPLSLKPEYVSVEAKPESHLPEKKPEYVTEEIISSTIYEPEYVSTTAQPEQVTLIPAKPEQVTLYPAKPEQVTQYPAKPTQVFYPAKPAQVSLYPAKPTFSSFPSWSKYTTSAKVPFVSAVKPLNNVQAKPEYISTTEFQQEEVSTTFAPKYEATTTSKPEHLYPAKPAYVASLPIKQEYVHSEASLPAKEVVIQTSPVKPVYGSQQTVYVSSPKPFFAPTKSSLVAAVPLQAQQVSYSSSSYRQPGYLVPAIFESKYTTSYPSTIEYESSTVAEPEYTTARAEYTTYKPEYTTAAEPEYTTLQSEFEYATTESQLDATVKPQNVYVSVQSKPQAAALTISGSASTEKKPYFAGYSTFSAQKQEAPKVQTTYVSSVQSQTSGLAELTPVVSVSIPAKQQVQGQIASQDQATVLQQSHFSYFDKPAPVVVATQPPVVAAQPPKTEGFTSFTKLNINNGNASKVESTSTNTYVSSKPQFSFGTFGSGYVFNKTVTPSSVTSTVNVTGVTKNNQKWPQTGQYVSSSSWQGSNYNNNKPFSYYSSYKPTRWNSYPGQYQGQYQTGQYQTGQYKGQYQGQYNTGLYRPTVSSTTFKPLYSSSSVKSIPAKLISALV